MKEYEKFKEIFHNICMADLIAGLTNSTW